MPRYYDPQEEERKERLERLRKEMQASNAEDDIISNDYRQRIAGSFRSSRRRTTQQADTSAAMLRLAILLFLVLMLMAYLQFGAAALYGLLLFVPFYFLLKFRKR
ncbi:MAG: hypothetical protein RMK43_05655 [Cyclobacteriaceae bacterium]|nr:hypothetical protein [Cyclobacteriaceae bacterium]